MKLTPLKHIRSLEKSLFEDIRCNVFDLNEEDDLTIVIAELVHWVITDSEYGLLANVKPTPEHKQNLMEVVSLYEEWIKTGIKPSVDRWNEKQQKAHVDNIMSLVEFYERITEEVIKNGTYTRIEIRQAQYNHIQESIHKYSNSALYSFDEYEKE